MAKVNRREFIIANTMYLLLWLASAVVLLALTISNDGEEENPFSVGLVGVNRAAHSAERRVGPEVCYHPYTCADMICKLNNLGARTAPQPNDLTVATFSTLDCSSPPVSLLSPDNRSVLMGGWLVVGDRMTLIVLALAGWLVVVISCTVSAQGRAIGRSR